ASATNTLVRTATGWRASNTDSGGLADALRSELGVELRGTPVILLGAGGAARAAAVQCLRDKVASLWIGNRGTGRLGGLLTHLAPLAGGGAGGRAAPCALGGGGGAGCGVFRPPPRPGACPPVRW